MLIVAFLYFCSAYRPQVRFELVGSKRQAVRLVVVDTAIDHISPTIASLRQVWNHLPHLWLFAEAADGERIDVQRTREEAARALANYFLKVE